MAQKGETKALAVDPDAPAMIHIFKTIIDPYVGRMSFFKVIQGTVKSECTLQNVNQNKSERIAHVLFCKGKKTENMGRIACGRHGRDRQAGNRQNR